MTRVYRGYLIRCNILTDVWWIEKDGFRISGAKSATDAKGIIDDLLEDK